MGSAARAEPQTSHDNRNRDKKPVATNRGMTGLRNILESKQIFRVFVQDFSFDIVRQLTVIAQIVQILRELVISVRNVRSVEEMFRADIINGGRKLRFAGLDAEIHL
jgi:hypothetical protein